MGPETGVLDGDDGVACCLRDVSQRDDAPVLLLQDRDLIKD
jgi:hypothetical protein